MLCAAWCSQTSLTQVTALSATSGTGCPEGVGRAVLPSECPPGRSGSAAPVRSGPGVHVTTVRGDSSRQAGLGEQRRRSACVRAFPHLQKATAAAAPARSASGLRFLSTTWLSGTAMIKRRKKNRFSIEICLL